MSQITLNSSVITLGGNDIQLGEQTSKVELVGKDLSKFSVGGQSDKIQILICVPSLDTPVCASEARKFNQTIANDKNFQVYIISMDLPFAMGRFCTIENIENLNFGSDFRKKEFGKKYGVLQTSGALEGLLARAVFIINKNGNLIYKQVVKEITNEPNYEEITQFLKSL